MELNKNLGKVLRLVDSDLYSIYTDIMDWTNETIHTLDSGKKINHPLKDFAWCSYSTMADRLSMSRAVIGKKIDMLVDLGIITKYTYNFILKDRKKDIEQYNLVEVPKINQELKRAYKSDPFSREMRIVKPINLTCNIKKVFVKVISDFSIAFCDFKIELLSDIRKKQRETEKKYILKSNLVGTLISKNFDRTLEMNTFDKVKSFIKHYCDTDIDYDKLEESFNRLKGKLNFSDYTFTNSFDDSIVKMTEIINTTPLITMGKETFSLHKLQQEVFINAIADTHGLNELLTNVKKGRYLFFFMLELYLRNTNIDTVSDGWNKFKTRHQNWRSMNLLYLLRSLRKFIHYSILNNEVEVEQIEEKNKYWYFTKERKSKLKVPPVLSLFKKDLEKFEFFNQAYYKSDTGEEIYPFYFYNNYANLSSNGENYYPNWVEIINKHGGSEKEGLKKIYDEILPVLQAEVTKLKQMKIVETEPEW